MESATEPLPKVEQGSPEWVAFCARLQEIRVLRARGDALLNRRPKLHVGRRIVRVIEALDAEERQIRARLPFDPSGL